MTTHKKKTSEISTGEKVKELAKQKPATLEQGLYSKTDEKGNQINQSELAKYPGSRKYKPNKDKE